MLKYSITQIFVPLCMFSLLSNHINPFEIVIMQTHGEELFIAKFANLLPIAAILEDYSKWLAYIGVARVGCIFQLT